MKKVFDQTVRDLKREVNKTVLKVPRIEQKVLDATNNEPWGPHGTVLADISQATRNYHEYQMIMTVLWKRINDTGKNWRHVYKALTVLDYLVANGSERVIDEIKEHSYQISTLSDFQYIDSSGRDQGSNVRKKAQTLVNLVNDKERIIEVRQKAAANRDKFRNTSSSGGMYRPGGYGDRYDDNERYGSRDEDKNGVDYGREKERDEDRYDRNRDSYSRDEDRHSRDYDERQGRDDDNWRRSRSVDDFQRGSSGGSIDRDRERTSDDDGRYSSRSSGAKVDDQSQNGKGLDKKFSEQNIGAPPSYEEALSVSQGPVYGERDEDASATPAPITSGPLVTDSQAKPESGTSATVLNNEAKDFDEFDPRSSFSAAPSISMSADMDLLGSLTESFSNPLAIIPAAPIISVTAFEPGAGAAPSFSTLSGTGIANETYADPFGDSPFKAVPSSDGTQTNPYGSASTEALHSSMKQSPETYHGGTLEAGTVSNFGFGESFSTVTYPPPSPSIAQYPSPLNSQDSFSSNQDADILADILPPPQTNHSFLSGHPAPPTFPTLPGHPPQMDSTAYGHLQVNTDNHQTQIGPVGQFSNGMLLSQSQGGSEIPMNPQMAPPMSAMPNSQINNGSFYNQLGGSQPSSGPAPGNFNQHNFPTGGAGYLVAQTEPKTSLVSHHSLPSSTGSVLALSNPSKDKFETKSTVWADTLSRGLVNLNISGPKTNPLADIGVDFDSLNRKEKRMEKPSAAPVASTITMGKAMGSGTGMGRSAAGTLRPPPNPTMGSTMGMGPPGGGMGMGGYGGMTQQPMGMNMGMGMNMNMGMGMNNMGRGMNMGMSMGQQPLGVHQGPNISPMAMATPGGYNPMMNTPQQPYGGGYPMMNNSQQPYGGGYR